MQEPSFLFSHQAFRYLHLEEVSQYFRIFFCKFLTAKYNGGLNAGLDGKIKTSVKMDSTGPIKFVKYVVFSPCETQPFNNLS